MAPVGIFISSQFYHLTSISCHLISSHLIFTLFYPPLSFDHMIELFLEGLSLWRYHLFCVAGKVGCFIERLYIVCILWVMLLEEGCN